MCCLTVPVIVYMPNFSSVVRSGCDILSFRQQWEKEGKRIGWLSCFLSGFMHTTEKNKTSEPVLKPRHGTGSLCSSLLWELSSRRRRKFVGNTFLSKMERLNGMSKGTAERWWPWTWHVNRHSFVSFHLMAVFLTAVYYQAEHVGLIIRQPSSFQSINN